MVDVQQADLKIEFLSYWRCGAGASGAGNYDDVALRDPYNFLPYVPAKHYKGLLREAAKRSGFDSDIIENLFGSGPHNLTPMPGCLNFRDAVVSSDIRAWIRDSENHQEKMKKANTLFFKQSSTSIDHETGVAKQGMLRSFEVVAPVTLKAQISWQLSGEMEDELPSDLKENWVSYLNDIATLVWSVGGLKNDGYGDAVLSVTQKIIEKVNEETAS
jgi:CRISPR/Cas system CSM-associated protein Csm3 (group 7 of RAMP superfamily)